VLSQPYSSLCAECDLPPTNLPDMGLDRSVAISSNAISKIQQRQLKGIIKRTFLQKIGNLITPLTPSLDCFSDHLYHNKRLSFIASVGFSPTDAVQERIKWSKISSTYDTVDILEFGFKWAHMIEMQITPDEVHLFSWQQQQKNLELTAQKLLQTNISLSELAQMKYTTHQLLELGFDWNVMTILGASVDSWGMFDFSLEDIKTYWNPSLTDLVSGGFYDRNRIKAAGWDMDEVMETLPNMTDRSAGRVMRLAF
tara:strand:+ start:197 stop:958 length:762 start_codon:yes stop_codon:yes gene_type:complete